MEQGTVRVPELASQVPVKEDKGQIKKKSESKICHLTLLCTAT